MNVTRKRSFILYFIIVAFIGCLGFFLFEYFTSASSWATNPVNKLATAQAGSNSTGRVYDRNGVLLAYSQNGERLYNSDKEIRCSMLHAVGDTEGNISTGVQTAMRSRLTGYNLITGLGTPFGLKTTGDVTLTIDSSLNKTAYELMNGQKGAAMIYNWKTGEILSMVSNPGFDPQNPPQDIGTNAAYDGAYVNKVLSGALTPGSIFKIVTTVAASENMPDLDSQSFHCDGSEVIGGSPITCTEVHGDQNFQQALANSCNIAFAHLSINLGANTMTKTAEELGFNKSFEVDGIPTAKSSYNVSTASENQLGWSGVGQYTDTVNPCHMARILGAIANGGNAVTPHFVKISGLPDLIGNSGESMMSSTIANRVKAYLRWNVQNYYGDKMFPTGMQVCAKTGTAELGENKQNNGWMVGFSQNDSTPYAFVVVVEDTSQYGYQSAGRVASGLMQAATNLKK